MSKHPSQPGRVFSQQQPANLGGRQVSIPCFLRGQNARLAAPDHFLALDECRRLRQQCLGEFINRGKAFRRFDVSMLPDQQEYQSSHRPGESLKIQCMTSNGRPLEILDRFVNGEKTAVAAVTSWLTSDLKTLRRMGVFA